MERRLRCDARCESKQVWSIISVSRNGPVEGYIYNAIRLRHL